MRALFIFILLFFSSSCSILENMSKKDPVYVDIAKAFTEATISELLDLDDFSFDKSFNIEVTKSVVKDEVKSILGAKIYAKITEKGRAPFVNLKVDTYILWYQDTENPNNLVFQYIRKKLD